MSEKVILSVKQFDKYVKTLQQMEAKIKDHLSATHSNAALYSEFYHMFSTRRRGFLRELLEDLELEGTLVTHWRRDPGQPPVKIYSLPEVDTHKNPQEFQDSQ